MKQFAIFILTSALLSLCTDAIAGGKEPWLIGSASHEYTSTNYSLSFSLGETVSYSFLSPDKGITVGFLQPILTKQALALSNPFLIDKSLLLYPNPATDKIYWNANAKEVKKLTIFAGNGIKIIEVTPSLPELDIAHLAQGIYYVQLSGSENSILGTFKLVKN